MTGCDRVIYHSGERHPAPPAKLSLRLLLVSSRCPDPEGRADQRTVYRLLKYLAGRGHRVHLIALDTWESPVRDMGVVARLCERVQVYRHSRWRALAGLVAGLGRGWPLQVAGLWNPAMARAVRQALAEERPDLIYVHLIRSAEYVRGMGGAPKLLAMQIAQSLNLQRMVRYRNGIGRLGWALERRLVERYERAVAADFERCAVISVHDRDAIGLAPQRTWLVPHGVDLQEFHPAPAGCHERGPIIFSGVLDTAPNLDAARWLLGSIWPQVLRRQPAARLQIVGRNPPASLMRQARAAGVEVIDSPPRLAPYLRAGSIGLVPMRIAAGLQNKLLEALASGLAVVATPTANQGIGAVDGRELILAEDAIGLAEGVARLWEDQVGRQRLATQGRRLIERCWSWEYHWRQLEKKLIRLSRSGASGVSAVADHSQGAGGRDAEEGGKR
ncbi:MAG TPA: glycosyltransferase [Candidatus Binataceae bacterium]|nr:glycosyltransferase [Candidatus Binataceae bacterium]